MPRNREITTKGQGVVRDDAVAANRSKNPSGWSSTAKTIVSIVLLAHLTAIFSAPWSSPPPSSYASQVVADFYRPYLEGAYLYHGYRFFAPNPGPSHLVRYVVHLEDGSKVEGRFPDRQEHWPRLFYHRHFMLSETIFNRTQPFMEISEEEISKLSPRERDDFQQAREPVDALVKSVAKHLLRKHEGVRVELFLQQHDIAGPLQVQEDISLDDERFWRDRKLGEFTGDEL